MYDEFFPTNKVILDKSFPRPSESSSAFGRTYFKGTSRRKFTEWVKKFIPKRPDNMPLNNLSPSMQNFEDWG